MATAPLNARGVDAVLAVDLARVGYTGPPLRRAMEVAARPGAGGDPTPNGVLNSIHRIRDMEAMLATYRGAHAHISAVLPELRRTAAEATTAAARADDTLVAAKDALRKSDAEEARLRRALATQRRLVTDTAIEVFVTRPDLEYTSSAIRGAHPTAEEMAAPVLLEARLEAAVDHREELESAHATAQSSEERARVAAAEAASERDRRHAASSAATTELDQYSSALQHLGTEWQLLTGQVAAENVELERAVASVNLWNRFSATTATPAKTVDLGPVTVHESIAWSVGALLELALEDGIRFTGFGLRDPSRQIELRLQNCGPTPFDIFQKSPGECSPPTALPGTSMHERGLAVDFDNDGASIVSRDDPAFIWLQQHAPMFGLHNLPSEPWHWSVTGR